ncbi:hypothetical protein ACU635_43270 [[Actinomadura] parvosata]|uniref:hypothetical protein n=1 Tax=[Actinomadura] parvosata TaxID=1955412 RepID=UPI00406C80D6
MKLISSRSRAQREQDKLQAERVRLAKQRLRDEARREQELADLQHKSEINTLTDVQAQKRKRRDWSFAREVWAKRLDVVQRFNRTVALVGANVGVNLVAITGQFLGLWLGQEWPWVVALLTAVITETIAINVGFYAHDKLLKGYSPIATRTFSYLIGFSVGVISYMHNHDNDTTKDAAILFALASCLNPILWHMYGVWKHSDNQHVQGTHKPPAPSFPWQRWAFPSLRPETKAAYKLGIAEGISDPDLCIQLVRQRRQLAQTRRSIQETQDLVIRVQRDTIRLLLTKSAELADELYGMPGNADAAINDAHEWINRFGTGLIPRYLPKIDPELTPGYGSGRPIPSPVGPATAETETSTRDETPFWKRLFLPRGASVSVETSGQADSANRLPALEAGDESGTVPAAETKPNNRPSPTPARDETEPRPAPGPKPRRDGDDPRPKTKTKPKTDTNRRRWPQRADVDDLMPLARDVAADFAKAGTNLTRDGLVTAFRERGQGIGTAKAKLVLDRLAAGDDSTSVSETKTETDGARDEDDTKTKTPSGSRRDGDEPQPGDTLVSPKRMRRDGAAA